MGLLFQVGSYSLHEEATSRVHSEKENSGTSSLHSRGDPLPDLVDALPHTVARRTPCLCSRARVCSISQKSYLMKLNPRDL